MKRKAFKIKWRLLRKICLSNDFLWPVFFGIRTVSKILSLFRKIHVEDNPYSRKFYALFWYRQCFEIYNKNEMRCRFICYKRTHLINWEAKNCYWIWQESKISQFFKFFELDIFRIFLVIRCLKRVKYIFTLFQRSHRIFRDSSIFRFSKTSPLFIIIIIFLPVVLDNFIRFWLD